VKLHEGRNNQIRIMFKHFGRLVEKLKRVRIGPVDLGPIKPGQFRYLDADEVDKLKRAIQVKSSQARDTQARDTQPRDTQARGIQSKGIQSKNNQVKKERSKA
jgi:hypothetical protein